jgi:hypothetical protein
VFYDWEQIIQLIRTVRYTNNIVILTKGEATGND